MVLILTKNRRQEIKRLRLEVILCSVKYKPEFTLSKILIFESQNRTTIFLISASFNTFISF